MRLEKLAVTEEDRVDDFDGILEVVRTFGVCGFPNDLHVLPILDSSMSDSLDESKFLGGGKVDDKNVNVPLDAMAP